MSDKEDYLTSYREFFENFAATVNPEDQLPVNIAGYTITEAELPGEVLYWTTQYLTEKQCPQTLITPLLRIILDEVRAASTKAPNDFGYKSEETVYIALRLMQAVTARVNEICLRYLDNSRLDSLPPPPPLNQRELKTVSCATKNSRRVMEDRHTEIGNLEALFGIETTEPTSFYAVYDGHAGSAAAMYCAAHLHQYLVESPSYTTDLRKAMRDAFLRTDADFVRKSNQERANGGSTAVCVAVRGRRLYAAWAGDSLALLAKRMRLMQLVRPHKPSRQDERDRIESSGGTVIYWGTWRVNGQLAVSRAIGDAPYKPYVTARPEIATVELDGDEDFVVVACDGLWDFVSEDDVALAVYRQLAVDPDDLKAVTKRLVVQAKRQGSADNISIIVVFLKEPRDIVADNACPPMDLGLDNALANAPPFVMESEACKRLDATVETNGQAGVGDNGLDHSDDSDSEDFGPETAVDIDADEDMETRLQDPAPPTPPAHTEEENHVDGGLALADNVAESGEDSEDEWNYFKGEGSERRTPVDSAEVHDNPRSPTPSHDNSAWETSSVDMNSSPLNPDAPVFVPGTAGDVLLAESPRKPVPMDDIELPDVAQFQTEAVVRPNELLDLDNCDQLNGHHNVSIDEKITEQLNGNKEPAMESLGFGFSMGIDEKPTDNGLIHDLQRIQKDTTDFCDIHVFQAHNNESNPFAMEGNEELLERLKNKERDPMSMSFYQEKDNDTCERSEDIDLNAVRTLPDSDSEDDSRDNIENVEPDNDLLGLSRVAPSAPNNFMDFNNDPFRNNDVAVAPTDTPESHKLLFEQIPEIPDGKTSELGFNNDDDSERDRASPQEISNDVEMPSKIDTPSEEHELAPELKDDLDVSEMNSHFNQGVESEHIDNHIEISSDLQEEHLEASYKHDEISPEVKEEDLIEPVFEPKASATPDPEQIHNSHEEFECTETTADIHCEDGEDRLRGDVLETDLDAPEEPQIIQSQIEEPQIIQSQIEEPQIIQSQIDEQAFQFQSQIEAPAFQFNSEVPVETHATFTESPLPTSPVPVEASPVPSPVPVQAPSPLAQPLEPSPAPSPLPAESPAPTPTPAADTPAPDIVPEQHELVTDIDVGLPESHAQEICLPVTSELPSAPTAATPPPAALTDTPIAADIAPAVVGAVAATAVAAAATAAAVKKTPASTKKAPATPKSATTPKPAPKTSTTARTPLSAKKPATATPAKASPVAKTTPARTPLAAKPAPITKAAAAPKPAAPAAKPAAKPAPRPATARVAPTKPAAKEAPAVAKTAPIARVAPISRPAPKPLSRPATAPAKPATTAAKTDVASKTAAKPAPKPAAPRAPISRPATTAARSTVSSTTAARTNTATKPPAERKPLTNGTARPAPRPAAPRPAPRQPPTKDTAATKNAAPMPVPRARPVPKDADKLSKDLANKRLTAKAAPPRTAPAKAPASKPAPIKAPKKVDIPAKETNGPTNGPTDTNGPTPLANGLEEKLPPAELGPPTLPDVIA